MDPRAVWYVIAGLLVLFIVVGDRIVKNGPVSTAILYLLIGILVGPHFLGWLVFDPVKSPEILETAAEIVVIVSLFSAGLKLRAPFLHDHWRLSLRLSTLTMILSVAFAAFFAVYFLELSWPLAILLGGILAPTDPVLASAVQVEDESDRDRLRYALTGEAGLNDGTAFPVVMLGLTWLGFRWTEHSWAMWFAVDVVWATAAGLAFGYLCGWIGAKVVNRSHPQKDDKSVVEDFVALGMIATSYGGALAIHAYGFLAVFACGLAFARVETCHQEGKDKEESLFSPALIRFSTQLERMGELATVVFIGAMLGQFQASVPALLFGLALVGLIRPLAVLLSLRGTRTLIHERLLISWFGIRGIGSVYYLAHCLHHGVGQIAGRQMTNLVLTAIAISIIVHGISANPSMELYDRYTKPRRRRG